MKNKYPFIIKVLILLFVLVNCSNSKELSAPLSLYKTGEAEKISHQSYDKAMTLWDIDYKEDYVVTDYGQSHVIISGKDDAPPLILLPGLFCDATMWYANVGELSKYFKVYSLDLLVYGGKSQPSGKAIVDINDYKLWFTQILNHYKLTKVTVAGLSYSSWISLALAREMPQAFSSVILLDPSESFMPMNGGIAWKGFKAFMFFPNREKYSNFFDWIGGGYTDPKMEIWFEHMLNVIDLGSAKVNEVPMHRIYEPGELKMITMPVLIMAGGKPIIYKDPEEFKHNAQTAIPHAQVIIVPGTGHGLNMEKPEVVNKAMVDFVMENL